VDRRRGRGVDVQIVEAVEGLRNPVGSTLVTILLGRGNLDSVFLLSRG
jgi:hypothetical protein